MSSSPATTLPVESLEPHWVSRAAFPVVSGLFMLSEAMLAYSVYRSWLWVTIPLALILSHLMHGQLIGFHEASHGMLRKNRKLNEIDGVIIGILSFTSFSLYRAAHQMHHVHLTTERDEEFWPFVHPEVPRWARMVAAFLELFVGLLFTPFIFIRTFFRASSPIRNKKVRRRIWFEFTLTVIVWTAIITASAVFGLWKYLLWMYLIPAYIAANLQSWRKYIEHIGMTGTTVRGATRSVIADDWIGKLVSFTLLHEPFHGVHHQRAGLTHAELPLHSADLTPTIPEEKPPFRSYGHALLDLLHSLSDPRVGPQWLTASQGNQKGTPARS
jgi:fatty acid desaturase